MDESLTELGEYCMNALGGAAKSYEIYAGQLTLWVERDDIVKVLTFLRDDPNCLFKQLVVSTPAGRSASRWYITCSPCARISGCGSR